MNKKYISLLTAGLLAGAVQALAVPTNITIADKSPDFNGFTGDGSWSSGGTNTTGLNVGLEDNETERVNSAGFVTIAGQQWDMEGFIRDGSKLYIVAGYDLLNGQPGGRPGDLFIKVGGTAPSGSPTAVNTGNVANGVSPAYGYTYAVDLSLAQTYVSGGSYSSVGSFGSTATVYDLNAASMLNTAIYDQSNSNPWKVDNSLGNSFDTTFNTNISYSTNVADPFGQGFAGSYHNVLEIDISFLGSIPVGTNLWFSYTMECGNDSLKGNTSSGLQQVPDNGMSALFISLGLAATAVAGFKRRRA